MGEARINAGLLPLARPIESLRCDPRNARRHAERDLAVLRQSLELHGQQKPIVALRDGKVIAGNGTLEAARSLGWERLAVVTYDDEDAAKAAEGNDDAEIKNRAGDPIEHRPIGNIVQPQVVALESEHPQCADDVVDDLGWIAGEESIDRAGELRQAHFAAGVA